MADDLEKLILAEGAETIAAFFGEPVMGAGGVVVPPAGYWQKIQAVLAKYDILLVADEIICGFGRTGEMFGTETFGLKPDIMVLSKQISSSYCRYQRFSSTTRCSSRSPTRATDRHIWPRLRAAADVARNCRPRWSDQLLTSVSAVCERKLHRIQDVST